MLRDEDLDALDTFALAHLAPNGEESVREYGRAVERAAYEAAACECEKRSGPIETYNRAYPGYLDCAAAIRALMAKEQPK